MDEHNRRRLLGTLLAAPFAAAAANAMAASPSGGKPAGSLSTAQRLDVLESKDAIAWLLNAYARANDRADEALLRSLFWPESTHKHGKFEGKSSDFVGFAFKIVSALHYACHHITNISIEVKGDHAFSECYYFAQHRRDRKDGPGEEDVFFQGRYLDDLERRNGVWKIIRRRGLSDYTSPPIASETPQSSWPAGQHSEKAPSDDYYKMLAEFRAR
ncbi:nuclear transport factor 2 family protein [Novosphingobium rosa]|uniref:nuclear transport factor 2 family protein n=1 Tax=Novosphingobium rosa TaxID=76978 RepID=UPI0008297182|nr:nuclear transport factor 2 family protein [Novosphingobium rosa]